METGHPGVSIASIRRVLCGVLVSAFADQPNFSCASPNAIKAAICADPALSARDRTMVVLYAASLNGVLGPASSPQQATQRQWLKTRKECLKEDLRKCLADKYDARLNALAIAALFHAEHAALAELARQDPKVTPIYEAIYRYATQDTEAVRIAAVEPLIAPIFKVLSGMPTALFEDMPDARAVASSDKAFALFLDVASVSDYPLTLPCAALVHRPGLMHALGPQYGGAIDGRLISADCASTLPPLPKLERLKTAATSVQETCNGTIRFSLGRDYEKTLLASRLHRVDVWTADGKGTFASGPVTEFRSRHRAHIADAITELTRYYISFFKVTPQVARDDATSAINAIVAGAFNLCEVG